MTNDPNEIDELLQAAARDYNRPEATPRDAMWERIRAQREVARREARPTPSGRRHGWWLGAAAAAVLVMGVAIGRVYERRATERSAVAVAGSTKATDSPPDQRGFRDSLALADSASRAGDTASRQLAVTDRPRQGIAGTPDAPRRSGVFRTDSARAGDTRNLTYRVATLEHLAGTEAMLTSFRAAAKRGEVDAEITRWARSLLTTTRLLAATSDDDPAMKRLLGDLELVLLQIGQYTASGTRTAEELELIEHSIERRGVIGKIRTTIPARYTPAGT